MKLYNVAYSGNSYKVRLLLAQLGLPCEIIEVNILKGESRTPEFLKINPNGRTPVLDDNGFVLAESNAILAYLARGTKFLPEARKRWALVFQWMFFEQYSHEPYIAVARAWLHVFTGRQVEPDRLREKMEGGYRALDVMERHLADRRFFVAERYTIADIALYAYTHVAHEGDFHLGRYPHIRTWLPRVASQPGHVPITQREFD